MARDNLRTGFTGDVDEERPFADKTRAVLARAKDEAGLVSAHAVDHPAATGAALMAVGLLGLAVGYMLGVAAASHDERWR